MHTDLSPVFGPWNGSHSVERGYMKKFEVKVSTSAFTVVVNQPLQPLTPILFYSIPCCATVSYSALFACVIYIYMSIKFKVYFVFCTSVCFKNHFHLLDI